MKATQLSGYRLMWIFVMFDLPVDTKAHAHEANKFRQFLLDEGFEKSQFSVYARFCNGKEQFETYMRRIEAKLPQRGEVHILNSPIASMKISSASPGSAKSAQRKIPTNSPCFDCLDQKKLSWRAHKTFCYSVLWAHPE